MERLNPIEQADWDACLAKNPAASFFQTAAWSAVLQDTYGYSADYLVEKDADSIHALLPLMEVNSWLTGRRGISLPFTDECEPICSSESVFKEFFQTAVELGKQKQWKYLEFRGGHHFLPDAPASLSFFGHQIDLTGNEEALFSRLSGSVRQGIRKAEKSGVTVEMLDTMEGVKSFYTLFCQTRKKHGMPPQPFRFFQKIHQHVIAKNLGRVFLAHFEGQPVAAAIYLNFGRRAIYKFGASNEAFQQARANNLVMWEAIKHHARKGLVSLHLGRTSSGNDGLRRFKLNWGALEERIDYVKYDLKNDRYLTDIDQASGWHNSVFKNTPIAVSRLIGECLYPHWA